MDIYESNYSFPPSLGPLHTWPSHNAKCIPFKTSKVSVVLTISTLFERPKSKNSSETQGSILTVTPYKMGEGSPCLRYTMTHSKQDFAYCLLPGFCACPEPWSKLMITLTSYKSVKPALHGCCCQVLPPTWEVAYSLPPPLFVLTMEAAAFKHLRGWTWAWGTFPSSPPQCFWIRLPQSLRLMGSCPQVTTPVAPQSPLLLPLTQQTSAIGVDLSDSHKCFSSTFVVCSHSEFKCAHSHCPVKSHIFIPLQSTFRSELSMEKTSSRL